MSFGVPSIRFAGCFCFALLIIRLFPPLFHGRRLLVHPTKSICVRGVLIHSSSHFDRNGLPPVLPLFDTFCFFQSLPKMAKLFDFGWPLFRVSDSKCTKALEKKCGRDSFILWLSFDGSGGQIDGGEDTSQNGLPLFFPGSFSHYFHPFCAQISEMVRGHNREGGLCQSGGRGGGKGGRGGEGMGEVATMMLFSQQKQRNPQMRLTGRKRK